MNLSQIGWLKSLMKDSLISVIICTYNRVELLQLAINSIFEQKYQPIEIIVIDDGSTDSTEKLVSNYKKRIRYFKKKREGIAKARTFGCKVAKGEFISFLDDDDLMPQNKNLILYNSLIEFPNAIFAVGDWSEIDHNGNPTGKRSRAQIKSNSNKAILIDNAYEAVLWPTIQATAHTTLFRKMHGEQIHWFDEQYRYASEDKDFYARLGKLGPIVYIPQIVSYYRIGHRSLTSHYERARKNKIKFLENNLNKLDATERRLNKRLRFRIYQELIRLSSYRTNHVVREKKIISEYINSKLSYIGMMLNLKFFWLSNIHFPAKKILKKLIKYRTF